MKLENHQLRTNLDKAEAKVAEQQMIINYQRKEIDEYQKKNQNQDEQLKKLMESAVKNRSEIEEVNKQKMELKNQIDELQKLLKERYFKFLSILYNQISENRNNYI